MRYAQRSIPYYRNKPMLLHAIIWVILICHFLKDNIMKNKERNDDNELLHKDT